MKRTAAILLLLSVGACAKGEEPSATFIDTPATEPPPAGPVFISDEAGVEPPTPSGECEDATKQIFVLGTDKSLYRFDPQALSFTRIGTIGCATAAGTFSMAIDRRGTAWVEFTDGNLFAVDTRTAACKPTAFRPGQTGFETFGMGYALNGDSANGETLYAAGAGLAALDTKTFELSYKGSLSYGRTELTGLDTQLFAFSVQSGVVVELDKTNGASKKVSRTSAIDASAAFAFAQWGGAFWIFTGNTMSQVTRYDPLTDVSTVPIANAGILIVGAGSSTCAPTKPPG